MWGREFDSEDGFKNENQMLEDLKGMSKEQVCVRMISGDHLETCKRTAILAGIIMEEEKDDLNVCMTGDQFMEKIGLKNYRPRSTDFEFAKGFGDKFKDLKKTVRVIARCNSDVKLVYVKAILEKGGLVGMTGDSINDAKALKAASVGFCMGSGCDVAKDSADLIIDDNNFGSIFSSIKWGR
jgi:Ca2+-transporting ATPase